MVAEKKLRQKPRDCGENSENVVQAEPFRIGNRFVVLNTVASTCGTVHKVKLPAPVALLGIFVNLGICSIEVIISGKGNPVSRMIPSRAGLGGAEILIHPAATEVTIKCLGNVQGGDCKVVYLLVW